jgi:FkbH-like protein
VAGEQVRRILAQIIARDPEAALRLIDQELNAGHADLVGPEASAELIRELVPSSPERANALRAKAVALWPAHPAVCCAAAELAAAQADWTEALASAEHALTREPRHPAALRLAADAQGELGRTTEAVARYAALLEVDRSPNTAAAVMARLDRLVDAARERFEWPAGFGTARVAVIGNITTNFLVQALRAACLIEGWYTRVWAGGFDLYRQELLDPASGLYTSDAQVILLVLDWRELVRMAYRANLSSDPASVRTQIDAEVDQLTALLSQFRSRSQASVLVTGPISPSQTPLGVLDAAHERGLEGHFAYLRTRLGEKLHPIGGVYVQQTDRILSGVGKQVALSAKMDYLARMPYSPQGLDVLARDMASFVRQARGKSKKCLVLDLDNTLWGGIIGEDGLSGIKLGPDGVGRAYLDFQHEILRLHQQGVILAICSKNNEQDVAEVFQKHPHMVLRPEHFAAVRINWQDKPANLRALADEINIGIDSLVVLDDNPVERGAIRQLVPQVLVPDLPRDPVDFPEFLRGLTCFQSLQLTEEDLQRGRFYADERRRQILQKQAGSIEEYLAALEMVVNIRPIDDFTQPRIVQLINRTNQFNLTARRYSETDVQRMRWSADHFVFSLGLEDRYGDNGIVGVAILWLTAADDRPRAAIIDSLLMSCRILGRNVERAFLGYLAEFAARLDAAYIEGQYIPSDKNAQVADFYPRHGFAVIEPRGSMQRWRFACRDARIERPPYIRILDGSAAVS